MLLAAAVLSGFVMALIAPWLHRIARKASGWVIALFPMALTVWFAGRIGEVAAGEVFAASYDWVPSLGITLSLFLDGLSLLFALLISGIGALVVVYAGCYLAGHAYLGRFYAFLLMFLASMLGLVLANNIITLFVFWELTSVSSYLLIGFEHEREAARRAALQSLLVTSLGGLALLAGLLLLGQAGGSMELSELLTQGETIREHPFYLPMLLLILAGAFTKSAQFPFHFWLPSAMQAPTPVSAYLHSATMVKAGIYLLARLSPALGGTETWFYVVTAAGAATMLVGAYLAFQQSDLKLILAYSTVSALGMIVLLIGLGTNLAMKAAIVSLLAHALYKGTLFLVAGAVDHETGTRDVDRLGGLRRAMPLTAAAAMLAALSMAGFPPLFGFIGKEMVYEAAIEVPTFAFLLIGVVVLSSMFFVALAGIVGLRPFLGGTASTPRQPHEAPLSLWLGPSLLAGLGLLSGLFPGATAGWLVTPAVAASLGRSVEVELALFHGWSPVLLLSAITLAGGFGLYASRDAWRRVAARLAAASRWGAARWYELAFDGINGLARAQTRFFQSGYLRYYLATILATTIGLAAFTLVSRAGLPVLGDGLNVPFYQAALAGLILLAALATVRSQTCLAAVAALGVVGYGVALIFVLFGAPDLAMTQFLVETLTVILLVLVLYHLPPFKTLSTARARARDAAIALLAGGLITALVLAAGAIQPQREASSYMASNSATLAHGRNVVNVILVDFRGLDTFGEITVLAVAGIGVYSLLKLRIRKGKHP